MGSKLGILKIAAKRIGISYDEYMSYISSGLKWCRACRLWISVDIFNLDRTRGDGRSSVCNNCRRNIYRRTHTPKARQSQLGTTRVKPRDGDKKQARRRINHQIKIGLRPHSNELPCVDCGHVWNQGERRHEYDHYCGYEAKSHDKVEVVCTKCHRAREIGRGNYVNKI